MKHAEARLKNIANLLRAADKNLKKANKLLETMRQELDSSFDDVPGVLGTFDGSHMVDADGKRHEVNPNYAAKSLLVVGDNLKMVEDEEGKKLFKQVSKVDRKQLDGVLNKKEGKWYALTDEGSYRLLDVSIEFREGEVNDEVTVLVPADNPNAEWGVLEKMAKEDDKEEAVEGEKEDTKEEKEDEEGGEEEKPAEKEEKPKKKAPAKKKTTAKKSTAKKSATKTKPATKKKTTAKKTTKKTTKKASSEEVDSLLDEDDLR